MLGPVPEDYVPVAAPEPGRGDTPRKDDQLSALKRETIVTLKEFGLLTTGKKCNYEWAFWAAQRLAQARIPGCHSYAIDEETDEKLVVAVHNLATEQLRLALKQQQERAA